MGQNVQADTSCCFMYCEDVVHRLRCVFKIWPEAVASDHIKLVGLRFVHLSILSWLFHCMNQNLKKDNNLPRVQLQYIRCGQLILMKYLSMCAFVRFLS